MKPRAIAEQSVVMQVLVHEYARNFFIYLIINREIRDQVNGGRLC
jgi:hypothetical protein